MNGTPLTLLRFSGGEAIEVELPLSEVQGLIQQAIAEGRLLELHAPDGRELVVNPHQIQYLQNGADVEADANGGAALFTCEPIPTAELERQQGISRPQGLAAFQDPDWVDDEVDRQYIAMVLAASPDNTEKEDR